MCWCARRLEGEGLRETGAHDIAGRMAAGARGSYAGSGIRTGYIRSVHKDC